MLLLRKDLSLGIRMCVVSNSWLVLVVMVAPMLVIKASLLLTILFRHGSKGSFSVAGAMDKLFNNSLMVSRVSM